MGGMSLMHWLIVILILLVFFGPSRLPELGKGLGQAIRGFKKGLSEDTSEDADDKADTKTTATARPEQIKQSEKSSGADSETQATKTKQTEES